MMKVIVNDRGKKEEYPILLKWEDTGDIYIVYREPQRGDSTPNAVMIHNGRNCRVQPTLRGYTKLSSVTLEV